MLSAAVITFSHPLAAQEQRRSVSVEAFGTQRYTSVAAARALSDGRVLVSDPESATLWVLTSNGVRRAAKVTEGGGRVPGGLRALGGDTTLLFDRREGKFVLVLPDGAAAPAPSSFTPPEGPLRLGTSTDVYAADSRSRLYWMGLTRTDTAPLWARGADGKATHLATLQKAPMTRSSSGGITISRSIPFAPLDAWAVGDDGTVVIARGTPYRVDRVDAAGSLQVGAPVVLPVSKVSAGDRAAHEQLGKRALGSVNLGGASLGSDLPAVSYPEQMASFVGNAVRVTPDGMAWVHRAESTESPDARIDVFEPGGSYRETLVLPRGAVVVGFGPQRAFVTLPVAGSDQVTLHTVAWR